MRRPSIVSFRTPSSVDFIGGRRLCSVDSKKTKKRRAALVKNPIQLHSNIFSTGICNTESRKSGGGLHKDTSLLSLYSRHKHTYFLSQYNLAIKPKDPVPSNPGRPITRRDEGFFK